MALKLRIRSPTYAETLEIEIEQDKTVRDLKQRLNVSHPLKPAIKDQRLIFAGKLLNDDEYIQDILHKTDPLEVQTFHLVVKLTTNSQAQNVSTAATPTSSRNATASQASTPSNSSTPPPFLSNVPNVLPTNMSEAPASSLQRYLSAMWQQQLWMLHYSYLTQQLNSRTPSYPSIYPGWRYATYKWVYDGMLYLVPTDAASATASSTSSADAVRNLSTQTPDERNSLLAATEYTQNAYNLYYQQWMQTYHQQLAQHHASAHNPPNNAGTNNAPHERTYAQIFGLAPQNNHEQRPNGRVVEPPADANALAGRRSATIWLAVKLLFLLFIFSQNAGLGKVIIMHVAALLWFLWQTGRVRVNVVRLNNNAARQPQEAANAPRTPSTPPTSQLNANAATQENADVVDQNISSTSAPADSKASVPEPRESNSIEDASNAHTHEEATPPIGATSTTQSNRPSSENAGSAQSNGPGSTQPIVPLLRRMEHGFLTFVASLLPTHGTDPALAAAAAQAGDEGDLAGF
ncbi:hypothetical protein BZG36_03083 [Bifiguratus adelaidae]|uniref:Ubiquitin-like domain-containing protein n=1 Tax=Bifiguratus adelaidae TaxID=1938954 RepID=A0A261XZE1_9FUNG|nr:hypothetical protein BZG36_03083 [Bifiguratus adelaidae]